MLKSLGFKEPSKIQIQWKNLGRRGIMPIFQNDLIQNKTDGTKINHYQHLDKNYLSWTSSKTNLYN